MEKCIIKTLKEKQLDGIDYNLKEDIKRKLQKIKCPNKDRGKEFVSGISKIRYEKEWFIDKKLNGFCNHSSRAHISDDLYRYFFAAMFA